MIALDRDIHGRLRVPFFVRLICEFCAKCGPYNSDTFKTYVAGLEILTDADWDLESNGYAKWKHRIDRAWQKVSTDV